MIKDDFINYYDGLHFFNSYLTRDNGNKEKSVNLQIIKNLNNLGNVDINNLIFTTSGNITIKRDNVAFANPDELNTLEQKIVEIAAFLKKSSIILNIVDHRDITNIKEKLTILSQETGFDKTVQASLKSSIDAINENLIPKPDLDIAELYKIEEGKEYVPIVQKLVKEQLKWVDEQLSVEAREWDRKGPELRVKKEAEERAKPYALPAAATFGASMLSAIVGLAVPVLIPFVALPLFVVSVVLFVTLIINYTKPYFEWDYTDAISRINKNESMLEAMKHYLKPLKNSDSVEDKFKSFCNQYSSYSIKNALENNNKELVREFFKIYVVEQYLKDHTSLPEYLSEIEVNRFRNRLNLR